MHRHQTRFDSEATAARNFTCPGSYVSFRVHPGTEHRCEYLAGDDKTQRRREIFERDGYRCVSCGDSVTWDSGEWDHGGTTKMERCDCLENGTTKCGACHGRKHARFVRFGEVGIA